MDIIGVIHLNKYATHLEDYIRKNYIPSSIMLELEPNVKPNGYFGILDSVLKNNWQIIHGDKYYNYHSKFFKFKERIENIKHKLYNQDSQEYSSRTEALADLGFLLTAPIKNHLYPLIDAWNPELISKRNQGFYETIDKYSPELVVVGAAHAFAIKKENPESKLKLFFVDTASNYMCMSIYGLWSLIYSTSPDEVIFYPKSKELLEKHTT